MAYSLTPSLDSCYEGTTCLINKLGIRDEDKLSDVEAQITFAKAVLIEGKNLPDKFDFEYLKQIHEFLFCDLYDWAGKIRTADISKKRTKFLSADSIERVAKKSFARVCNGYFDNLSFDEFTKRIAEFYNDVNFIHPFREGNGRAQRIYFTHLIRYYGYDIDFSAIDTDELMIATIQASGGVMDFLIEFFRNAITK